MTSIRSDAFSGDALKAARKKPKLRALLKSRRQRLHRRSLWKFETTLLFDPTRACLVTEVRSVESRTQRLVGRTDSYVLYVCRAFVRLYTRLKRN